MHPLKIISEFSSENLIYKIFLYKNHFDDKKTLIIYKIKLFCLFLNAEELIQNIK